jgi:hypothetical protein
MNDTRARLLILSSANMFILLNLSSSARSELYKCTCWLVCLSPFGVLPYEAIYNRACKSYRLIYLNSSDILWTIYISIAIGIMIDLLIIDIRW